MAQALISNAGFLSENVTLLASNQPDERLPTRGNILRRLSNLAAVVPSDGLLLFAFAGHSIERSGQAFLLPSDAQVGNDVDLLEQTAINVTQVKDRIRKAGVKQVLMILDACRNDPVGRANADNPLTAAYTRGLNFDLRNREVTAFATLYATEVGRRAYEYKEKHQGYFTWALVEGLKGGAANERGEVTLAGLVNYLQERVPKRVLLDLGAGKDQRPFAVIEGYRANDLIIAVPGVRKQGATDETAFDASASAHTDDTAPPTDTSENRGGESASNLTGTLWEGSSAESGDFTIELLADGKIRYTVNQKAVGGTWKQAGTFVRITVNNGYSVLEGTVEGQLMKVQGSNVEGAKWNYTLTLKPR